MTFDPVNIFLFRAKTLMKFLGVWILYIVIVWGDLDAVSQASYVLFTQACLCFKITVLHTNSDMLEAILLQMNSEVFRPQSKIHERILTVQARRIKRLLLTFLISAEVTCGLWALKPLFDDIGHRKFPFDMWMPVDPGLSPQYQLGYIFQLTTICISACMYFGVDSVTLSSVIFVCAQMEIIMNKIMSIKTNDRENGEDKSIFYLRNNRMLLECVKQHQAVVIMKDLVENTYHTYLLFQLTGSVGLICMSAFRILAVEWCSMQMVSIVTYLLVMISQLFLCCWCGHELTATSEELHQVLYQCSWHEQDAKFKRMLCFTMMRMNQPMVLRAGHYITLSRNTFVSILRMSYSYLAVLNQTKQ
ncbi:odorant receptor Or1-like [Leptidea sinapis]|uniref:odorant receptor Or1-like n=1 Tax=Leptidea sinapis TaxID=189913 RepID=UPI0021C3AA07|nr:odorant receptor Or1-like [Leptidea sinapis]